MDAVIPVVVATPRRSPGRRSATVDRGMLAAQFLKIYQWVVARLPSRSPALPTTLAWAQTPMMIASLVAWT